MSRAAAAAVLALLLAAPAAGSPVTRTRVGGEQCGVTGALPSPPAARPHYALTVRIQPRLHVVTGALTVMFSAPQRTDRLVFRLWPNGPRYAKTGAHLSVAHVREGGRARSVSYPNPTTLVVQRPLNAGERATISMDWRLVLPHQTGLRLKGGGQSIRLGSFFPVLAWDGGGWALDPPAKLRAESWTTPTADFDVRVTRPAHLQALASGAQVGPGTWRARAVRDFTLTLGRFTILKGIARVPAEVRVTIGVSKTPSAAPARWFLKSAVASLRRYSALYGPYPWRTYTVVAMPDLNLTGGLEYPTLVYQPAANDNVAHETAHQWFYSLVGNNQARDPWLDEGLATWAEARVNGAPPFPQADIPPEVENRIGEPMTFWDRYDYQRFFLGAYLQSYRALLSLGTRQQVDCALRRYVLANAYGIASPRDLLDALRPTFPDAEQKLTEYGAHF